MPPMCKQLKFISQFCITTLGTASGKPTDELHFAKLPIMDNLKCQEMYNKYNEENKKNIKILDQQVCAGHTEGKIDGCQVSWAISVKKVLIDEYLFAPHTLLVSFVLYFFCLHW